MLAGGVVVGVVLVVVAAYVVYRYATKRKGWIEVIDSKGDEIRIPLPPHSVRGHRTSKTNERFTTATMAEIQHYVHQSLPTAGWALGDISSEPSGVCLLFRRGDKRLRILMESIGGRPFKSRLTISVAANVKATPLEEEVDAIKQLGEAGDREAVSRLTALLEDARPMIRREAASALAKIKDERSLWPLIGRLKDDDTEVRQSAAFALGELCRKEAVEALIAGLRSSDAQFQMTCAWSLGRIKDSRAVTALITALEGPYWKLKMHAAMALGEIADKSAVEPLIVCLKDRTNHPKVRAVALASLTRLVDATRLSKLIQEMPPEPKLYSLESGVKTAVAEAVAEWAADTALDLFDMDD